MRESKFIETKKKIIRPVDLLSSHPSLVVNCLDQHGALSKTARQILVSTLVNSKSFKSGRHIGGLNRKGVRFAILTRGCAMYWRVLPDGRRQIISILLAGDEIFEYLNLVSLAGGHLSAITDIDIATITDNDLNNSGDLKPEIMRVLDDSRSSCFHKSLEQLSFLKSRTAVERVSALLFDIFLRSRQVTYMQGLICSIPLTQSDLASYTGFSHVHICRSLASLKNDKVFIFVNRIMEILDLELLNKICSKDIVSVNDAPWLLEGAHQGNATGVV